MSIDPLITVDPSALPDPTLPQVDFHETSFFRQSKAPSPQLPEPWHVQQRINEQNPPFVNGVIVYEDLDLAVKCGCRTRVEEALTLRMMNLFLSKEVPTPELFGWRIFEGNVYIYMALVHGATLNASLIDGLEECEKAAIAAQLCQIVLSLRRLRQVGEKVFLGSVSGGPLWDFYWAEDGGGGPFNSVREFNTQMQEDSISFVPLRERKFDDPYRRMLPDSCQVFFSHADLSSHNVLISGPPGARRVAAVLDWEQSGWYPEYWEYCKMVGPENRRNGWLDGGWAGKVMKPYEDEFLVWGTYWLWKGC